MSAASRPRRLARASLVVVAALAVAAAVALLPERSAAQDAASTGAASVQLPQVAMPDAEKIVLLLRTTLLTLNDALNTGNFTVLRDVAAPGFREANTAARLSRIFGNLSGPNIDLTVVAVRMPQISEAPTIDPKTSMLRLKGFFPGQLTRIDFEVLFQPVAGRWRLFGMAVQPTSAASVETAAEVAPKAAPMKKKVESTAAEPSKK